MKPHLLKISVEPQCSFSVRNDVGPFFYNRLHFHPEIELVYIRKGRGTQFIGSNISRFEPGDVIMVGSNLTHLWRCDEEYFACEPVESCEAAVLHFHPDCFGKFFHVPENKAILQLIKKAQYGVRIQGLTKRKVQLLMIELLNARESHRIVILLTILTAIAESCEVDLISEIDLTVQSTQEDASKLDRVFKFCLENFYRVITLKEIAAVAFISSNSFCRYFKSKTRKTFSSFLIEIRIAHACKLLADDEKTVYEVCYESGFNNLSNFNRSFKKLINKTPYQYKKEVNGRVQPRGSIIKLNHAS